MPAQEQIIKVPVVIEDDDEVQTNYDKPTEESDLATATDGEEHETLIPQADQPDFTLDTAQEGLPMDTNVDVLQETSESLEQQQIKLMQEQLNEMRQQAEAAAQREESILKLLKNQEILISQQQLRMEHLEKSNKRQKEQLDQQGNLILNQGKHIQELTKHIKKLTKLVEKPITRRVVEELIPTFDEDALANNSAEPALMRALVKAKKLDKPWVKRSQAEQDRLKAEAADDDDALENLPKNMEWENKNIGGLLNAIKNIYSKWGRFGKIEAIARKAGRLKEAVDVRRKQAGKFVMDNTINRSDIAKRLVGWGTRRADGVFNNRLTNNWVTNGLDKMTGGVVGNTLSVIRPEFTRLDREERRDAQARTLEKRKALSTYWQDLGLQNLRTEADLRNALEIRANTKKNDQSESGSAGFDRLSPGVQADMKILANLYLSILKEQNPTANLEVLDFLKMKNDDLVKAEVIDTNDGNKRKIVELAWVDFRRMAKSHEETKDGLQLVDRTSSGHLGMARRQMAENPIYRAAFLKQNEAAMNVQTQEDSDPQLDDEQLTPEQINELLEVLNEDEASMLAEFTSLQERVQAITDPEAQKNAQEQVFLLIVEHIQDKVVFVDVPELETAVLSNLKRTKKVLEENQWSTLLDQLQLKTIIAGIEDFLVTHDTNVTPSGEDDTTASDPSTEDPDKSVLVAADEELDVDPSLTEAAPLPDAEVAAKVEAFKTGAKELIKTFAPEMVESDDFWDGIDRNSRRFNTDENVIVTNARYLVGDLPANSDTANNAAEYFGQPQDKKFKDRTRILYAAAQRNDQIGELAKQVVAKIEA